MQARAPALSGIRQETFFVLLEQTPSERRQIKRPLKLLAHEATAD
ncbi:hypothetical protein [Bradyrhizobium sp. Tv2a-2]|nr:hypothetical protein [Bradyrhizobium sp. Tv2a-2]